MTESQTLERAETPSTPRKAGGRMPFLDWSRGLAALLMIEGHTFDSFARPELRETGPFILQQFVGGIAPSIFLFLTGVTLAFMMDGRERKGASKGERIVTALRRAGYLALLAFAFRLQLWLFGWPHSPVANLLKVDVLNCMAAAIALMSGLAALTTSQRVHAGIVAGALIAAAAPFVSMASPEAVPAFLWAYFEPNYNLFALFPWAAFVAFGISAGSILRLVRSEDMHKAMQWSSIIGFGLILAGQYFSNLPYSIYPTVEFWLNSPGLVFIKLGVILVILALAFLWTHHGAGQGWSWMQQLGTASLLVYWVHIELVYGRWFWFWKNSLTLWQCALFSLLLTVAMIALSRAKSRWRWPDFRLGAVYPAAVPRRVSGD